MLSITTTTCAQSVLITRVVKPEFGFGAARLVGLSDRQTDSFDWDTNPHTPRLYYKPAPPLRLPRHNDLLGLHRHIMGMETYYASPSESRRPVAPLVKCGDSWCSDVYHWMCITERLEEDVGEEPPV